MKEYTVLIESAEGNFSAYCPDLPGCVSTGATVEDTVRNMEEAIKAHLEVMRRDGLKIPQPSTTAAVISA